MDTPTADTARKATSAFTGDLPDWSGEKGKLRGPGRAAPTALSGSWFYPCRRPAPGRSHGPARHACRPPDRPCPCRLYRPLSQRCPSCCCSCRFRPSSHRRPSSRRCQCRFRYRRQSHRCRASSSSSRCPLSCRPDPGSRTCRCPSRCRPQSRPCRGCVELEPLPAVVPPSPRVEDVPVPEPLPAAEPPVPSVVLDEPEPVVDPPAPNVELVCAYANTALPARKVAAKAALRILESIIASSPCDLIVSRQGYGMGSTPSRNVTLPCRIGWHFSVALMAPCLRECPLWPNVSLIPSSAAAKFSIFQSIRPRRPISSCEATPSPK